MPIEPVDPSKKPDGDGKEKYSPGEKRGPGKFDEALEKAKSDRAKAEASKMAEEHRAKVKAESPRTYAERLQDMGRLPTASGAGSADLERGMMGSRMPKPKLKVGGKVTASSRADGCAVRGKTKGRIV
jgi:hypothetical protein